MAAQVDVYILNEMEKHHIPGLSIRVIRDGSPLLLKGYGMTNLELSSPTTEDTVFEIALEVAEIFSEA